MATYQELMAQAESLQAQAEEARQQEISGLIFNIKETIKTHGITAEDLGFATVSTKATKRVVGAPKYRNPTTGLTWTGKGKKPAWVKAHLANGGDLAALAIQ